MSGFNPSETARRFVAARRAGRNLPDYPGPLPTAPEEAYACQDAAIGLWPDDIAGWKVGRIPASHTVEYGTDRLAGPVFRGNVWPVDPDATVVFPVIAGGFSAVEAEFIFRLRAEPPSGKLDWTREEAAALDWEVLLGVEIAGSPLPTINDLGPAVTISDFGNNAGVILGGVLEGWREVLDRMACETFVDGRSVGAGVPEGLPGGPVEGVRFLLEHAARRGRPLQQGQFISSGAVTGVHPVEPGAEARLVFGPAGEIRCKASAAAERD